MNLPDDCKLTYYFKQEQYYWNTIRHIHREEKPGLQIVAGSEDGGCAWEFSVEEIELGGRPNTRLRMFQDAYAAFVEIPELFAVMADETPLTLKAVASILRELGAEDVTERLAPEAERRNEVARLREEADRIEATLSAPADA